jgi:pyochelin biosynthetic protein PchC
MLVPHAGGSAHAYRDWGPHLDSRVGLIAAQYPGRGRRHREPPPAGIREMVQPLAAALGRLTGPVYVFGHSLGALVGFELAWALEQRNQDVAALFVSSCRAPHMANPRPVNSASLSDDELVSLLKLRGGTPDEVLEDADMRVMVLDIMRRDFTIDDNYRYGGPGRRLGCPIIAVGGSSDPILSAENLAHWGDLSWAGAQVHTVPGGHFYFTDNLPALMAIIHGVLRQRVPASSASGAPARDLGSLG